MEYVSSSLHGSSSYGKGGKIEDLDDFQPDSDIMVCLGKLEQLTTAPVKEFYKVDPEYFPEAYERFELMATAAIQVYNQQSRTCLLVGDVLEATSLPSYPSRTRLTFNAGSYSKPFQTFEAEIEGCVKCGLKVISCNPVL